MLTISEFKTTSALTLSEVADLVPEVPKKTIRNLTDRGLVEVTRTQSDPRLYTLANALELKVMHAFANQGAPYLSSSLAGRMAVYRAEHRITHSLIGSSDQISAAVCMFRQTDDGQTTLSWQIAPFLDLGSFLEREAAVGRALFYVIGVDHLIEALIARWTARLGISNEVRE